MQFVDEILRKAGIGVWQYMPEPADFKRKGNHAGTTRINVDSLWRIGTRRELVTHYNHVMKNTYQRVGFTVAGLIIALISFTAYGNNGELMYAVGAILGAAIASRYWTKAWGGYAGDWADYEHDPVRAVTHNAYVLTEGRSMM